MRRDNLPPAMKINLICCGLLVLGSFFPAHGKPGKDERGHGLKDTVVLVIRHAEKPASGVLLSPEGEARAKAYVAYFKSFAADGKALVPEQLFACADSKDSHRPRLTLEPLSKALGLKIDDRFSDEQSDGLARELRAKEHKQPILICWHHSYIPDLLKALGADPAKLLPDGKWPDSIFGWVILLRFDREGRLIPSEAKRINESLMPDDSK
jgi:hypothetical protein